MGLGSELKQPLNPAATLSLAGYEFVGNCEFLWIKKRGREYVLRWHEANVRELTYYSSYYYFTLYGKKEKSNSRHGR